MRAVRCNAGNDLTNLENPRPSALTAPSVPDQSTAPHASLIPTAPTVYADGTLPTTPPGGVPFPVQPLFLESTRSNPADVEVEAQPARKRLRLRGSDAANDSDGSEEEDELEFDGISEEKGGFGGFEDDGNDGATAA
ncbi:hypothetical protein BBJ28_00022663 [Nothophytophthora sp. Chile5]|nr:hypothetical protein BBJ28_00022663 [Nothophytophthora sp. Chile5]